MNVLMKYFLTIFTYSSLILLCLGAMPEQRDSFLTIDRDIILPDIDHIELYGLGNQSILLNTNNQITLIPPDMAKIDRNRILRIKTDTLKGTTGVAKCISDVLIDSLFITEELFLTNARIDVHYNLDGTFDGESVFGWQALNQIGTCNGPSRGSGGSILIQGINPSNMTFNARFKTLATLALDEDSDFPFQPGDLDEIRLIKCSSQLSTENKINGMEDLLNQQPVFCTTPSVDPQVPPQTAISHIHHPVTIRFFEPYHAGRASALADCISFLFVIPISDVYVQDMLPAYNGIPPIKDYIEIWFQ